MVIKYIKHFFSETLKLNNLYNGHRNTKFALFSHKHYTIPWSCNFLLCTGHSWICYIYICGTIIQTIGHVVCISTFCTFFFTSLLQSVGGKPQNSIW